MKIVSRCLPILLASLAVFGTVANAADRRTKNVILVTLDGLRWQEVFTGADESLLNAKDGGVEDVKALRGQFWRDSATERRETLMPFLWGVIARQGQLYGDRSKGSHGDLKNPHVFSYPGYNEILTGVADPRIDSNAKRPNVNRTVLEWLHLDRGYQGKVAAFCAWDVFPYILNTERSGIPVMAGWNPLPEPQPNERQELINDLLKTTSRTWEGVTYDSLVFAAAREHLLRHQPRVLYVALGETDDWAHHGRYDHVLKTARASDHYIQQLWEAAQSMARYRDKTTLIITVDHGRGGGPRSWRDHGAKVEGAEAVWMAFLGPDTPPLGVRENTGTVTSGQVATSVAAFLGEDYQVARPDAPPPVREAMGRE